MFPPIAGIRALAASLGAAHHPASGRYELQLRPSKGSAIARLAQAAGWLSLPAEVERRLEEFADHIRQNIEGSNALEAGEPIEIPGLARPLHPFQQAGVRYMLRNPRTLVGDQQGLGKTVETIAALLKQDAFPALIVCPASVKHVWAGEWGAFAPNVSVQVVEGRAPVKFTADVVIANYDVLAAHVRAFRQYGLRAAAADEAHLLKHKETRRAQAVKALTTTLDVIYLLSGTPVPNKPVELTNLLDILGYLDAFGGYWAFVRRYCDPRRNQYGWDLSGAANLRELHDKLRAICMLRRTTRDVLTELPAVQRAALPVDIDNRVEYRQAETQLLRYIYEKAMQDQAFQARIAELPEHEQKRCRSEYASDKARKAARAEVLVRIETLKQLAAAGKMRAVAEWIDNYLAGTDDKLLIFATHVAVQHALYARYPDSVTVFAEHSSEERVSAVTRFQTDPTARLAIMSLQAGGVGLTMTAARHVLFVGYGWRSIDHDQAESRAYGRLNDPHPITSYWAVGRDTIDEQIVALLESKRAVTEMITDGVMQDNSGSVLTDLMRQYEARARETYGSSN
jgi:SNF2 family DNA or RNA helicase